MKCIIPGNNVKVFGRAIHSLSKIGEELYFEPLETGLSLRTVNSSRSAFACFFFTPSFFQHYDDGSDIQSSSADENFKCKITMKSCLTVFRSLSSLDRSVDRCKISLDSKEARIVFQLHCHHGIVKTHNLAFIECETLQAVYSKELSPNALKAQSRLLSDVVANFQTSQEEVSLSITPEKVSFKNYVDDEPDPSKVMHTELNLVPEEFENLQVGVDTCVTFCLKELRAILSFSDVGNIPLSLHFEAAGKPIVFSIDSDQTFEANFVLATLAESAGSANGSVSQTQSRSSAYTPATSRIRSVRKSSTLKSYHKENLKTFVRKTDKIDRNVTQIQKRTIESNNKSSEKRTIKDKNPYTRDAGHDRDNIQLIEAPIHNCPETRTSNCQNNVNVDSKTQGGQNAGNGDNDFDNLMNDALADWDFVEDVMETRGAGDSQMNETKLASSQNANLLNTSTGGNVSMEEEKGETDDDVVPGTPPHKKFKSLFFGWSQKSQGAEKPTSSAAQCSVLVENTDDEDEGD